MVPSLFAAVLATASCSMLAGAMPGEFPIPALEGCGKSLPKGQSVGAVSNVTISSSGTPRSYLISIPPSYRTHIPTPVILSYHGGNRDAEDQLKLDELTNVEFNTRSIVVYPQGINDTWEGVPGVTSNDVQFTIDILDELERLYCVDLSRITATGKSDGAGFGNVLACDEAASKRIAAFALVSGAYYVDTLPCDAETVKLPCSPARQDVPVLAFHGGNDTTIAYLGGERKDACLPTIPHFIREWAERDHLGESNSTSPLAADTVIYSFGHGIRSGLVKLIYESNIGHDWPSTEPNSDNTASGHHVANYNATPIILDFFDQNPLSISESLNNLVL